VPAEIIDEVGSPLTRHAIHDFELFRVAPGLPEWPYRREQEEYPADRQDRPSADGRRGGPWHNFAALRWRRSQWVKGTPEAQGGS
jgi:hypothetical protein